MKLLCATYLVFFLIMGGGEGPQELSSKPILSSCQPDTPPVELLSFTVFVLKNRTVKILWKTSKESNNAYFTVEHSSNAKDWEVLFQVKGAGNSQELLRYEGTDPEAFLGTSYYRLKQTDFDGTSSYSEIMELYIDPGKVMPLTVYPNPTRALLTIEGAPDELDSFSCTTRKANRLQIK